MENKKFEDNLKRLEEIVNKLENEDISLDDTLELYKEGTEISIYLDKEMKDVKEEVKILKERTEGIFEEINFENIDDMED